MFQYSTVNSLLGRFSTAASLGISNGTILERTGQVLDLLLVGPLLEESVLFLLVSNHKAILPLGVIDIIQLAKYNKDLSIAEILNCQGLCPSNVHEAIKEVAQEKDCGCISTCSKEPLKENTFIKHFEFDNINIPAWQDTTYYKSQFVPMYLSTNSMFHLTSHVSIENSNRFHEYVIQDRVVTTSFKEGIITVAVRKHKTDSNGFPLIPDIEELFQAIEYYIKWKHHEDDYQLDQKVKAQNAMIYNKQMYEEYAMQVMSVVRQRNLVARIENFSNTVRNTVTNDFKYSSMFSNLTINI